MSSDTGDQGGYDAGTEGSDIGTETTETVDTEFSEAGEQITEVNQEFLAMDNNGGTETAFTEAKTESTVEVETPISEVEAGKEKETAAKLDDNGEIYCENGKLCPSTHYELNGNKYATDEKGRIVSCEAKPVRSPENPRDNEAQRQAGGADRRPNDQGGHIVGRDINGDGGVGNLVAMDSRINQSDYRRMENDIKTELDAEKDVTAKAEMTYSGESERPDKITVSVMSDGESTIYEYDNNMDGSLDKEVTERSAPAKAVLDEHPDAHVSSVRRECDKDGKLVKTTACITWTDEEGNNRRKSVEISEC